VLVWMWWGKKENRTPAVIRTLVFQSVVWVIPRLTTRNVYLGVNHIPKVTVMYYTK
jgi:hypothetical protein